MPLPQAGAQVNLGETTQTTSGITANGAQTAIEVAAAPTRSYTLQVNRTAGSAAFTVHLEGSLDNSEFHTLAILTDNASSGMVHAANKPVKYIRANVIDVGTSNTLTTMILGGL